MIVLRQNCRGVMKSKSFPGWELQTILTGLTKLDDGRRDAKKVVVDLRCPVLGLEKQLTLNDAVALLAMAHGMKCDQFMVEMDESCSPELVKLAAEKP